MQRLRFYRPSRKDFFELFICIALAALFVLLSSGAAFAQNNVGINNATPHAKSLLDLTSSDKGLLTPRMTAAQRTAIFPVADATAKGMLVYQTDGAQGFYYYDGAVWSMMQAGSTGWGLLGNAGTTPATNFIGTTDNQPLAFRANNTERMRILPNGWVGMGTSTPIVPLDMESPMSIIRQTSTNSVWGSVVELKNTSAGTNGLGAINFNDAANTFPGQINYHPTDGMTFRSGGGERVRFAPNGTVGFGTNAPTCALDIAYPQATERITSTNAPNGAVIELRNTTAGTNLFGAVNFNDGANSYAGQLAYHATDGMMLRSGGFERMRIQTNGNVGINTYAAHVKSLVDMTSTDKGLLTPRMTAAQRTAMFPVADATAEGMLVYQSDGSQGFYYYDGAAWSMMQSGNAQGWGLLGNGGTNPATNFIGTTDNQSLVVRTNNVERARFDTDGDLGLGMNNPLWRIDAVATQAVARLTSTGHAFGSVIELKNMNPGTGILGAVNFNNAADGVPAQISYHPTDGMRFWVGGADAMRITNSQKVGIGTITPSSKLHVVTGSAGYAPNASSAITAERSGNVYANVISATGATGLLFGSSANAAHGGVLYNAQAGYTNALELRTGGNTTRMSITDQGNVTIGTSSFSNAYRFNVFGAQAGAMVSLWNNDNTGVSGTSYISSSPAITGVTGWANTSYTTSPNTLLHGTYGATPVTFMTNSTERLRIAGNGNVGMGTNAPAYSLDIASAAQAVTRMTSANSVFGAVLELKNTTAGANLLGAINFNDAGGLVPGQLAYHPTNGMTIATGSTERMRVAPNGNVGIGTNNPLDKLHVNGSLRIVDGTEGAGKVLTSDATGHAVWAAPTGSGWGLLGNAATNPATNFIGTTDMQDLTLRTFNSERMRITSNGLVGIGTNAPNCQLQVSGTSPTVRVTANSNGAGPSHVLENILPGSTLLGSYGFADATNTLQARISYEVGTGLYLWANGASRLMIAPSGNVGIGTTTPAEDLHVMGNIRIEDGTQAAGRVLTSDANGRGTWQTPSASWGLSGNSGTNPATNFIGTTDSQPLVLRTGNLERMRILNTGQVGIGIANPTADLHIQETSANLQLTSTAVGTGSTIVLHNSSPSSLVGAVNFVDNSNTVKSSIYNETSQGLILRTIPGTGITVSNTNNIGVKTFSPTAELEVNGYTKLASDAPAIKMKKLTGTTANTEGAWMDIAHGVTGAKILSVQVLIEYAPGLWVPTSYSNAAGYMCNFFVSGANIRITNQTGNSAFVLSKPLKVLITYEA